MARYIIGRLVLCLFCGAVAVSCSVFWVSFGRSVAAGGVSTLIQPQRQHHHGKYHGKYTTVWNIPVPHVLGVGRSVGLSADGGSTLIPTASTRTGAATNKRQHHHGQYHGKYIR